MQRRGIISSWHDRQITAGTDWAKAIDSHLSTASLILLLISSDFLASDYCYGIEMKRALERHAAKEARVIPILLRPVDWNGVPFEHLQALPTDARSVTKWPNQDEAFANIATGIRRAIESVPQLAVAAPPASLPSIWNIPYPRNPFFTGRDELLTRLTTALHAGQAMALSQALAVSGLGGIGKTQIAVEYAYRHRNEYQTVLWVLADTRESLVSGYIAVAELLKLPEKDAKGQEVIINAVKSWLQTHGAFLLILDNADDLAIAHEFVPTVFGGHLLLTTRAQAIGGLAERIEVETMEWGIGALLLLRRAGLVAKDAQLEAASPSDVTTARLITLELGGLPLALDQAGAYIEETRCGLVDYQRRYQIQRAFLLKRRGNFVLDHPEPVATTWSLSFERVEQACPAAADLLRLCAFLHPDAIPEEIFTMGGVFLGFLREKKRVLRLLLIWKRKTQLGKESVFVLDEAIAVLGRYSLVGRNVKERTLSIHRLVQAVLQDAMDEPTRKMWAERTVLAVDEVFPDVNFKTWPQCERCLLHASVCVDLIEQYQIRSQEAVRLLSAATSYLDVRARYKEEVKQLDRVRGLLSNASNLRILAERPWNQGKDQQTEPLYREAELLYREALSIYEQALEENHPDTAATLHQLGSLYQKQGKYEQAEPLYERALQIREQTLGADHPKTATTLHQLGSLYQKQGKYEQAERLYERALRISEQTLGADHPDTAATLHELARLYHSQGKYEQAELLYQRALRIYEQTLGADHPDTATTLGTLASLYQTQGKYEQAEPLYQRALRICEQALGADHPSTAVSLHNLATLHESQRKYTDAEPLFKRALAIHEKAEGPNHPNTRGTRGWYVSLLRKMGRDGEADSLER